MGDEGKSHPFSSFFKKKKVPKMFLGILHLWTPFRVTTSKENSNH